MAQNGYLLIADVSGYTAFLTQAELEHAQDILANLFKVLLDNIQPPLLVSKLEGDAIFCYVPEGSLLLGQTLLETIENIYYQFSSARERMQINTTCTCRACTLIPSLDLKFAVHYGEYVVTVLPVQTELHSADVIVVHRLLKNTVNETFNTKSYAFFTQAAADAMAIAEMFAAMKPHTEHYDHLGEVRGFVYDLRAAMERQRDQRRILVKREDAWTTFEHTYPVPRALLWDYLNDPTRKHHWMGVERVSLSGLNKGRVSQGSVMHCAHGKGKESQHMIEDWQPFDYLTMSVQTPMGKAVFTQYLFAEGTTTTRLLTCFQLEGKGALGTLTLKLIAKKLMVTPMAEAYDTLTRVISEDLTVGRTMVSISTFRLPTASPAGA